MKASPFFVVIAETAHYTIIRFSALLQFLVSRELAKEDIHAALVLRLQCIDLDFRRDSSTLG